MVGSAIRLDRVQKGDIDRTFIITHILPLEQAPHGYEIFQQKKDSCIKIVLKPGLVAAAAVSNR